MGHTWIACLASKCLVIPLALMLSLLPGHVRAVHGQTPTHAKVTTPCADVQNLVAGTCMSYTYAGETYVLCNGPFSLCTTANCTQAKPGDTAQCPCVVVPTGLSIRTALVDRGAVSALSNFASGAGLEVKQCPEAPLVNCLNASCASGTDPTTSVCTCPVSLVAAGGQIILQPAGVDVSCSVLRSGAPNTPLTSQLDTAFQAAQKCTSP